MRWVERDERLGKKLGLEERDFSVRGYLLPIPANNPFFQRVKRTVSKRPNRMIADTPATALIHAMTFEEEVS